MVQVGNDADVVRHAVAVEVHRAAHSHDHRRNRSDPYRRRHRAADPGRLVQIGLVERRKRLRRIHRLPAGEMGGLKGVAHDAVVVRLEVDVVTAAVTQPQGVAELVHEGPGLLPRRPAGRRPAAQRNEEIVAGQLRDPRVRRLGP